MRSTNSFRSGNDRNFRSSNSFRGGSDRNFRNSAPVRMHTTVCDECGNGCEVPFEPTGEKPIYCSACFEERGGKSRNAKPRDRYESRSPRFSRNENRPTMHQAVCDECGKDCEVPFMPSSDKPIYCSDCFGNKGGAKKSDNSLSDLKQEINQINTKLNQILEILNSSNTKTQKIEPEKKEAKEISKKSPEAKKVVSKKAEEKKTTKAKKESKSETKTTKKKPVTKKKTTK